MSALSISDTEGKTADQLIDESNGVFNSADSRYPATPQEAREIEFGTGEVSDKSSQASSSKGSGVAGSATSEGQAAIAGSNATEASVQASDMDLSGSWTIGLDDGTNLDLVLYQNAGAVFGTGSIEDQSATGLIAASGRLNGDRLNLDVISFGTVNLYSLTLSQNGDSIEGSYRYIPPTGAPMSGTATGSRP